MQSVKNLTVVHFTRTIDDMYKLCIRKIDGLYKLYKRKIDGLYNDV